MNAVASDQIMVRLLDPSSDRQMVEGLFEAASDYVQLEGGDPSGAAHAQEFFDDWPDFFPPVTRLNLGLFAGDELAGIIESGGGWPLPDDAYLGLMLFAPAFRGRGLGRHFFAAYCDLMRERAATRVVLGVLHNNPRARTFWMRLGFVVEKANVETTNGRLVDRLVRPIEDRRTGF